MKQFISVIIPVFNRKILVPRSIKSVIDQTHSDFELLVIDDCSEEDVYSTVKSFKDKRIKYFRNSSNSGVSYSRNIGIKNAGSEIIAFLDSDDEWKRKKLELQIKYLTDFPGVNIVHTEEIWIRNGARVNQKKNHRKSGGDIFIPSLELCLMSPSSVLMKKNLFEKYGLFNEELAVCEDYDMWLKITAFEKVGFIGEPLVIKYGGHTDQLSRKFEAMDRYRVKSLLKIIDLDIAPEKKQAIKNVIRKKIIILLNGAIKRNKNEDAAIYKKTLDDLEK